MYSKLQLFRDRCSEELLSETPILFQCRTVTAMTLNK